LDPGQYWDLTPRELSLRMDGAKKVLIREYNERAWLAYHTAFLPRMKRPPDFKKLLYKATVTKRRQTWQEQLHIAKLWHRALGKK
jgi:hypothetical protein